MKKILCPVDFSEVSTNGMEYASHLAKELKASLSLLHVRTSIWPEAIQLEEEVGKSNEAIRERLSIFTEEIKNEFGILCDYRLEQTTSTFEDTVASLAHPYDLVVMGTNGADTYYQYVFGSNSFHVTEKSKCPVIIIPEGCTYRSVDQMVYAYDPETNPIFSIDQLKKLSLPLHTALRVLHIVKENPSAEAERKMEILRDVLKAKVPSNISLSFDFRYANEVSWAVDQYMKDNRGDMLALSFHHRSLIAELFKENVVKQISMVAEYPLFVFWH